MSDLGHWVSNLEETVLGKLGPWDCVLAVLIADLTDIIDLVTSTDACALDELSLAIRTLLGAVNFTCKMWALFNSQPAFFMSGTRIFTRSYLIQL